SRSDLMLYEGQEHGFFNFGRGDNAAYTKTVREMDAFLVSLGWLKAADAP
ncbi:MAG: alpha/beta hydrolase, partial [Planctomycetes bacterium]|nr:alpha/beta hydrolase [Planctomycetota bacterium]